MQQVQEVQEVCGLIKMRNQQVCKKPHVFLVCFNYGLICNKFSIFSSLIKVKGRCQRIYVQAVVPK